MGCDEFAWLFGATYCQKGEFTSTQPSNGVHDEIQTLSAEVNFYVRTLFSQHEYFKGIHSAEITQIFLTCLKV